MSGNGIIEQIKCRPKLNRYESSFKQAGIDKLLQEPKTSIAQIAKGMNVSKQNLWRWFNEYRKMQLRLHSATVSELLSVQELFWVKETIGTAESDKIRYCRKYGIPYRKLLKWIELYKDERYQKHTMEVKEVNDRNEKMLKRLLEENKRLQKRNKVLEKERNRAVALLELKKNIDQLLGNTDLEEVNIPAPISEKES